MLFRSPQNPKTPFKIIKSVRISFEMARQLDEEEMQQIYNWVDEIPLSRPKRNIARDFSDCGKLTIDFSVDGRNCEALFPFYGGLT